MSTKRLQKTSKEKLQIQTKHSRYFSEAFKREKVKQIVAKQISIQELSKLYEISRTSLYNWLYRYSPHYQKGTKQVVEMESEALKTKALLSKVAELERMLGRKQIEIDFNNKVIELVNEELGYDVKKKYEHQLSNGLDNINLITSTK